MVALVAPRLNPESRNTTAIMNRTGTVRRDIKQNSRDLIWVRRGIWLYFWLLLFEGVLRKWVVPGLSAPLLIIRDPVVLFIYWKAYRSGRLHSPMLFPFVLVGVAMITLACIQMAEHVSTPIVAAYGLRCYLMHLPLIIVMAKTMDIEDAWKFGRWLLIVSIPMAALMAMQYYAPPMSRLNIGAGGGSTAFGFQHAQFSTDHVRPPGTFSFNSGIECYLPFVAAYLLYAISRPGTYSRMLVWPAAIATSIAIPLSTSRTVWFVTAGVIVWAVIITGLTGVQHSLRLIRVALILSCAAAIASQTPVFQDAFASAQQRWNSAAASEGDLGEVVQVRVLRQFTEGFSAAADGAWMGQGIGMGSNVAAVLHTGSMGFGLAEEEWPRIMLECGALGGTIFMGFRVGLCIYIFLVAFRNRQSTSTLGPLLASAFVPILLTKTIELPTHLGFMAWGGGLCLAAARRPNRSRTTLRTAPAMRTRIAGENLASG